MQEMIRAGAFIPGESFTLKDGTNFATLLEDGKLSYNGGILDMHTCAARAKGLRAKRVNGFDVWYVMRNGELVSISAVREKYRASLISSRAGKSLG